MRPVVCSLLIVLACVVPAAGQGKKEDPRDKLIKELRLEIATLKAKIADLEKKLVAPDADGNELVTQANYAKIKVTMTLEEVEGMLGKGKEIRRNGTFMDMRWRGTGKRPIEITITFRAREGFVATVNSKSILED